MAPALYGWKEMLQAGWYEIEEDFMEEMAFESLAHLDRQRRGS